MRAFRSFLIPSVVVLIVLSPVASRAAFDPARLPAVSGQVAQYSLTPGGTVDGLILDDGTEIYLPPHLGPLLAAIGRPGDVVTVRGLRARAIPVVQAVRVSNDATGRSVTDAGEPGPPPDPPPGPGPGRSARATTVSGVVRQWLHGPRGELNGLLLRDGTVVRFSARSAEGITGRVHPGMPVTVEGSGVSGPQGRVIAAARIGSGLDERFPREPRP